MFNHIVALIIAAEVIYVIMYASSLSPFSFTFFGGCYKNQTP